RSTISFRPLPVGDYERPGQFPASPEKWPCPRLSQRDILLAVLRHGLTGSKTRSHTSTASGVHQQSHKTKIHVQLLMAVKKRFPGIIRGEVYLDDLISVDDYRILQNPGRRFAVHLGQFETMPVQVYWVGVIALIAKDHAISFSGVNQQQIGVRIRFPIDRPAVEASVSAGNFLKD